MGQIFATMDGRDELYERVAVLEALVAELRQALAWRDARIVELETQVAQLTQRNVELTQRNVELTKCNEELAAANAELTEELRRRGKNYRPKDNAKKKPRKKPDQRTKPFRKHPGSTRPNPDPSPDALHEDAHVGSCPECGGDIDPTGEYDDVYVEDIPEPQVQQTRVRRHRGRCKCCKKIFRPRPDLDVPGGTVGPRARLLTVYSRAYLGISLGKTATLLEELFGLAISRAGALGHLRWFSENFDPVVAQLLDLLKTAAVVHADETGWRIDGKNVWCWCFSNPQIAVFLIDRSRSRAVFEKALGTSLPGVLVTDFYAAYHAIDAKKQRCIVHLLRDLVKLRDDLSAQLVAKNIQPLIELFQDAMALHGQRRTLTPEAFADASADLRKRFGDRWWRTSSDPDCQRIYNRLRRHKEELLTFLDHPEVPPDNNLSERDIRSVAATRADGGVNRTDWGAKAFGVAKSIIRTCQKTGTNFFSYGLEAIAKIRARQPPPLPIPNTS